MSIPKGTMYIGHLVEETEPGRFTVEIMTTAKVINLGGFRSERAAIRAALDVREGIEAASNARA